MFIGLGCLSSVYGETKAEKHLRQGNEYYSQGKYEQAIDEFQKVIKIDPSFVPPHYNLGNLYYQQGKFDDAITKFKKTIQIDTASLQIDKICLADS